jgi:hypothetical protein
VAVGFTPNGDVHTAILIPRSDPDPFDSGSTASIETFPSPNSALPPKLQPALPSKSGTLLSLWRVEAAGSAHYPLGKTTSGLKLEPHGRSPRFRTTRNARFLRREYRNKLKVGHPHGISTQAWRHSSWLTRTSALLSTESSLGQHQPRSFRFHSPKCRLVVVPGT